MKLQLPNNRNTHVKLRYNLNTMNSKTGKCGVNDAISNQLVINRERCLTNCERGILGK